MSTNVATTECHYLSPTYSSVDGRSYIFLSTRIVVDVGDWAGQHVNNYKLRTSLPFMRDKWRDGNKPAGAEGGSRKRLRHGRQANPSNSWIEFRGHCKTVLHTIDNYIVYIIIVIFYIVDWKLFSRCKRPLMSPTTGRWWTGMSAVRWWAEAGSGDAPYGLQVQNCNNNE